MTSVVSSRTSQDESAPRTTRATFFIARRLIKTKSSHRTMTALKVGRASQNVGNFTVNQEPVPGREQRDLRANRKARSVAGSLPNEVEARPYFCRCEYGMWRWFWSDAISGQVAVSREGFSNILDCERDALRYLKSVRSSCGQQR